MATTKKTAKKAAKKKAVKANRSAKTGKFVDAAEAAAHPNETVRETIKKPK